MSQLIELLSRASFGSALGGVITILFILSIFIEITPVKWSPLTSLLKWVGKKINGEILQKVDKLESKVTKIQYENARRSAINCRVRILTFGDELRQDRKHSKESFDQTIEDIDLYEHYCKEHPEFKNNRTQLTTQKILEEYQRCMDENDFL